MIPLKINFTDFSSSPAVTDAIERKASKIERFHDRVTSCDVFVSAPHQHEKKKIYHIRIHLVIPGKEFVVNRETEKNYAHHDIYIAIRDAFDALYRQLEAHSTKRQESFKPQVGPAHGRVVYHYSGGARTLLSRE
jgi:ribosomal subunit interface protein